MTGGTEPVFSIHAHYTTLLKFLILLTAFLFVFKEPTADINGFKLCAQVPKTFVVLHGTSLQAEIAKHEKNTVKATNKLKFLKAAITSDIMLTAV